MSAWIRTAGVGLCLGCLPSLVSAQDTLVARADGPPRELRLIEEVRVGALEGDERYTFGRIAGVAATDDGTLWVADGQTQTVRRYDMGGRWLADVGGEGEGPGEFKGIMELRTYPGDSIAVWDAFAWRVSIFDAEGTLGRTLTMGFQGSILYGQNQFIVGPDGGFWILGIDRDRQDPQGRGETPWIWMQADRDGVVLDTLDQPARDIEGPYMGGPGYGIGAMRAFGHWTNTVISPLGYMVTARNDRYALTRPLRDGRVLRIERPWEPVDVEPDERRQFEAGAKQMKELWAGRYDLSTDIPDSKPPFWGLWVDALGRIWVARHVPAYFEAESDSDRARRAEMTKMRGSETPPSEWWEPVTLDVFEPNGRYVGTAELASRKSKPMFARGDLLWTIEVGDFDEQYVVRYRMEPGG